MRPFIGITCSSDEHGRPVVRPAYVAAVHRAGGLPVALPFIATTEEAHALLDRLHGIVFTGSEDLDPAYWDEARHPATVLMHPARMATEWELSRAVLARRTPTLAVCGGMQTLNVAAGGSLHQHIPDLGPGHAEHSDPTFVERHPVRAEGGSRVGALLGRDFGTNSEHHQAVARLGNGLTPTAWCRDGLVEAFESADGAWLMAVQWHPERMLDEGGQAHLFDELLTSARAQPHTPSHAPSRTAAR